jgi:hypothetical protein
MFNSVELARKLISRARLSKEFIVTRQLDNPINFNGTVPFSVSIANDNATFKVLALSQSEAEELVNNWLEDRT